MYTWQMYSIIQHMLSRTSRTLHDTSRALHDTCSAWAQCVHTWYTICPSLCTHIWYRHACTRPELVHNWLCDVYANDPSAGSPTETLLRLLLPLSDKVHKASCNTSRRLDAIAIQMIHRITQSVGATGGVYKGQGRNQHELMTRVY